MAKKGGNKKKLATRNNKKKLITTTSSNESSSPPSPTVEVDPTVNSYSESLAQNNASSTSLSRPTEIAQELIVDDKELNAAVAAAVAVAVAVDQEENKDNRIIDATTIPSECSFENVVDQLDIATDIVHVQKKDSLEEPPHVEVKAEPVVVTLDVAPLSQDTTEPIVEITLEKVILAEVKPIEEDSPVKVLEDIKPIDETKPAVEEAGIVKPVGRAIIVEETKPIEETKPSEEVHEVEEIKPIEELKVDGEVKSIEQPIPKEVQPIEEVKPVEEATAVETIAPIKEAKPIEEYKPVVEVKTVEEAKPIEEVKPVEEIKLVEKIKSSQQADKAEETETKDDKKVEPVPTSQENNNETVAQEAPKVVMTSVSAQVLDTITIEEPSIIVTEVAPAHSVEESSAQEDTHTLRSQSVMTEALSATTEQSTIEEERYQEVAKPAVIQELLKDNNKKSFIRKSKSVVGNIGTLQNDPSVTKRKSQILGLFKRGGEREKVKTIKNKNYLILKINDNR